jgi:hypothetical protein
MRQGFHDDDDTDFQDYRICAAIDDPAPAAVPFRPPGIGFGLETACKVARG